MYTKKEAKTKAVQLSTFIRKLVTKKTRNTPGRLVSVYSRSSEKCVEVTYNQRSYVLSPRGSRYILKVIPLTKTNVKNIKQFIKENNIKCVEQIDKQIARLKERKKLLAKKARGE